MRAPQGDDAVFGWRESGDAYIRAWTNTNPVPTIFLALDFTVLWENRAAKLMFDDGRHFTRSAARMTCADRDQAAKFQNFLSGLGDASGVWACRSEDGSHLLVRADVLNPPDAAPVTVLRVHPAGSGRPFAWADLSEVFGLTPAEAGVAKRLVSGERAEAMARDLGISPETVRTHIRRIYSKLSISSREELFSVLSSFRIILF